MCYHRASPRLNEATHHPVLHMHSARREQPGCRTPTHSHTKRNRNTQQKRRHGTACTSGATCSLTAQFTLQTPESSESNTPEMWAAHSSSPIPSHGITSYGLDLGILCSSLPRLRHCAWGGVVRLYQQHGSTA